MRNNEPICLCQLAQLSKKNNPLKGKKCTNPPTNYKQKQNKRFHKCMFVCVWQSDNKDQLWGKQRLCEEVPQDEEWVEDGQDRTHRHPAVRHVLGAVLLRRPHRIRRVGVYVCVYLVSSCLTDIITSTEEVISLVVCVVVWVCLVFSSKTTRLVQGNEDRRRTGESVAVWWGSGRVWFKR